MTFLETLNSLTVENIADASTVITDLGLIAVFFKFYWKLNWFSLFGIFGIIASDAAFLLYGPDNAPQVEIVASISTIILLIGIWRQSWEKREPQK
jgi:hypothetical protein